MERIKILNTYSLLKKALFCLDPEKAHHLAFSFAKLSSAAVIPLAISKRMFEVNSALLKQEQFGLEFNNPIGLAAGFDKNAEIVDFIAGLGFGFIEIGSVTNLASLGNPKPRLFRLEQDSALINRMGLNNKGPENARSNILARKSKIPLGVNIAKTNRSDILGKQAVEDMLACYRIMHSVADYVVVNISCPNTEDGRTFEEPASLKTLLDAFYQTRAELVSKVPILIKFSADIELSILEQAISLSESFGVDGYVLTNTSPKREDLLVSKTELARIGNGGLSGRPVFKKAMERVQFVFRHLNGTKPIIGIGGIDSAVSAYEMIKAGASLVELYTGLVYQGPALVKTINSGLINLLKKDGLSNVSEAIGVAT